VVEQGLAPGERVVVEGQLRLTPGAKVEIKATDAKGKPDPEKDGQAQKDEPTARPGPAALPKEAAQ